MTAPDDALDPSNAIEFVRAHTHVTPVPLLPELRLHQADDAFLLWETTERDLHRRGVDLPYWAFAWAGGIALARYLLDHPHLVAGRRVLDLATGSGLVAIAAARAGAARGVANDTDPLALAAVRLNAALNAVTVEPLRADLLDAPADTFEFDLVLAGDVAYERTLAARVLALVARLRTHDVEAYIGDPGRAYLDPAALTPVATYEIPVPRALESADTKTATIWRAR